MGSRQEFVDAVTFIDKHKIRPIVHTVLKGLAQTEEAFKLMDSGSQFGKIVISVADESSSKL